MTKVQVKAVLFDLFDTLLLVGGGEVWYKPALRKLHKFLSSPVTVVKLLTSSICFCQSIRKSYLSLILPSLWVSSIKIVGVVRDI